VRGTELLAAVEALGWPELARSRLGRPIRTSPMPPDRPLLVVGGVHGDEPSSVDAVLAWVGEGGVPPHCVVVPALNPDGVAANRKNNAADVDLNRNCPARNFRREHAPGYDPGPHGGSEPETQALVALVERLRPRAVVAVHAPFACVNYDGPAAVWAERVAAACGWPARADIGYPTPGSLGSWLGVEARLPVLTIELPPGDLAAFRAPALAALRAAAAFAPAPTGSVE
jgi:murein peptide amidase A